jgi:DNA repair photolyase
VIRRKNALDTLEKQLTKGNGKPKYDDPNDRRVIYSSPLVDVAANMELVEETCAACLRILQYTNWQIRLLSKSNLLPKIAEIICTLRGKGEVSKRLIFGVSTGTLDDKLAAAFEQGTAKVSKRIESLHWLQDNGFRTFGMICPSLPQTDSFEYEHFAFMMAEAIRAEKCEHVWAEVINVRGESMRRTCQALIDGGFKEAGEELWKVSSVEGLWEHYNRETFNAHAMVYQDSGKLRYLVYQKPSTKEYWQSQKARGAVICNE